MSSKMKMIRESKGLGQKEVAAKLGMPVRRYGSYERGERSLSLDVAAQIADVFGVTIDELMNREYKVPVLTLDWDERTLIRLYRSMDAESKSLIMESSKRYALACEAKKEGSGSASRMVRG